MDLPERRELGELNSLNIPIQPMRIAWIPEGSPPAIFSSCGTDQLAEAPNDSNALARRLLKLNTSASVMQPKN